MPSILRHRNVLDLSTIARVENVFVNLVRKAERVEFSAKRRDVLHLGPRKNLACRVIGIADDDGLGFFVKGGPKLFPVERPVRARSGTYLGVASERIASGA